jgi:F0F1-type ATP synthase assembly protein I
MDTAEKSSENRDKMAKRLTPKLAWRLEERKEQESQNAASKQQRFA